MSSEILLLAVFVGIVVLIQGIKYICNKIADKSTDAMMNAYRRRKNKSEGNESENLSDRYRH